jgi:YfiH family protein
MIYQLIEDKVYYRFFDKTFKESSQFYVQKENRTHQECEANCTSVAKALNATGLVVVHQVHGNHVHHAIEPSSFGSELEADAIVTDVPGLALGIQTADCVPVLFTCKSGKVIGAAHCGWKSAKAGIIDRVIEKMEQLGAEDIAIVIGPSIQQYSYEVDDSYRSAFLESDPDTKYLFIPSDTKGRWMFDLPGYVQHKSLLSGVKLHHRSKDDTYSMEDKYHSYRRQCNRNEPYQGNLLSTIIINDPKAAWGVE